MQREQKFNYFLICFKRDNFIVSRIDQTEIAHGITVASIRRLISNDWISVLLHPIKL